MYPTDHDKRISDFNMDMMSLLQHSKSHKKRIKTNSKPSENKKNNEIKTTK